MAFDKIQKAESADSVDSDKDRMFISINLDASTEGHAPLMEKLRKLQKTTNMSYRELGYNLLEEALNAYFANNTEGS